MKPDYEKLYNDKCQQYRADMKLRNGQINEANNWVRWYQDRDAKHAKAIDDLKDVRWRSNIGWFIGGFILGLGVLGVINAIQ